MLKQPSPEDANCHDDEAEGPETLTLGMRVIEKDHQEDAEGRVHHGLAGEEEAKSWSTPRTIWTTKLEESKILSGGLIFTRLSATCMTFPSLHPSSKLMLTCRPWRGR